MKNESTLAIVQTALLGVIATLLLILITSSVMNANSVSAKPSNNSLQEVAVLCQITDHLNAEFNENTSNRRDIEKQLDGRKPSEFEKGRLDYLIKRNDIVSDRVETLNEMIEEKTRTLPPPSSQKK